MMDFPELIRNMMRVQKSACVAWTLFTDSHQHGLLHWDILDKFRGH